MSFSPLGFSPRAPGSQPIAFYPFPCLPAADNPQPGRGAEHGNPSAARAACKDDDASGSAQTVHRSFLRAGNFPLAAQEAKPPLRRKHRLPLPGILPLTITGSIFAPLTYGALWQHNRTGFYPKRHALPAVVIKKQHRSRLCPEISGCPCRKEYLCRKLHF